MYEYLIRKVHYVVDGDTFDLELDLGFYQFGVYRVRLLGVDTPELYGKYATDEGRMAKEFVEDWFDGAFGRGDRLVAITRKADSFGRWLASVYAVSTDNSSSIYLADDLIDSGLAEVYTK